MRPQLHGLTVCIVQAEYTRLANEVQMLQLEQLSQSAREEELRSRRDLLTGTSRRMREARLESSVGGAESGSGTRRPSASVRSLSERFGGPAWR